MMTKLQKTLALGACATHAVLGQVAPDTNRRDAYVGELNAALGIPKDLTELGIINPDLDRLTAEALKDPSVGGNPVAMNAENTRALFEACF